MVWSVHAASSEIRRSETYPSAHFFRLNVDEFFTDEIKAAVKEKELVPPFMGLPTIFLYKKGEVVDTVKVADERVVKEAIDKCLA